MGMNNMPMQLTHPVEQDDSDVIALLKRLFKNFEGNIKIRLWNGKKLRLGKASFLSVDSPCTLVLKTPQVVRQLVMSNDPLSLAEAYFQGDVDIEGDIYALLKLREQLQSMRLPLVERIFALITVLKMQYRLDMFKPVLRNMASLQGGFVRNHSRNENRAAIEFHYDVSNEFYALWLDPAMVYSCAYFEDASDDLAKAQEAKLDLICRKLMLKPGDRFLDIGCGWGALVIHAARHYGVRAYGVTLSKQQMMLAWTRIGQAGLHHLVEVKVQDYRDIEGDEKYDKIASVGMFEHVGLKNLPSYFSSIHRLLKPEGLFLNHGITNDQEGWGKSIGTDFINRYVFPDGQLETISNIQRDMEHAGFEVDDVEGLRKHYVLTLRMWVQNLERNHEEALKYVSESTYRIWYCYMAASALQFESGELGLYQILANKSHAKQTELPLTRNHLYVSKDLSI
jgi:cyclopropane-fatty-acyl-phospholipid synthase